MPRSLLSYALLSAFAFSCASPDDSMDGPKGDDLPPGQEEPQDPSDPQDPGDTEPIPDPQSLLMIAAQHTYLPASDTFVGHGTPQHLADGSWALDNADLAADFLDDHNWKSSIFPAYSLDELATYLDEYEGEPFDSVLIFSHGNSRGPFFDYAGGTGNREWLQAGWDWFGPGEVMAGTEESGQPSIEGLQHLTSRLADVMAPNAKMIFVGCNPANESNGTLFEEDDDGHRLRSYVEAFAWQLGSSSLAPALQREDIQVYGARHQVSFGEATNIVDKILVNDTLPYNWRRVDAGDYWQ